MAKTVKEFQEKICRSECILKGKCIEDLEKSEHWYKSCPHWFHYVNDIPYSFVRDNLKAQYDSLK